MYKIKFDGIVIKDMQFEDSLTDMTDWFEVDEDIDHYNKSHNDLLGLIAISKVPIWDTETSSVVEVGTDTVEFRDDKLEKIRHLRFQYLNDADVEINKLFDVDGDLTAMKSYRQALRDFTESFKNHATDSGHVTALNAVDLDAIVWPVKPS